MRILFIIYSLGGGGAERVTAHSANYFAEIKKWEVAILTLAGHKDFYALSPKVVRIDAAVPAAPNGFPASFFVNLRRIIRIRKELSAFRPDLVVTEMPASNVLGILAATGTGRKVVIEERIHPPKMPLPPVWRLLRKITYPFASSAVALTRKTAAWFGEEAGVPGASVIPNPAVYPLEKTPPEVKRAEFLKETRKFILSAGRFDGQKGFDLLIEAFSALSRKHPAWDLVILGDGPDREKIKELSEKMGLKGRVFFPGRAGNMGDWYEAAGIYALSSRFEGFPNVLIEAMSYGVPSVAFDCDTGPADIIRDGLDGILAPPENIESFAAALDRLMSDGELRKKFSVKAAEVRERFSMEKITVMWEQLFESLLKK